MMNVMLANTVYIGRSNILSTGSGETFSGTLVDLDLTITAFSSDTFTDNGTVLNVQGGILLTAT